MAALVTVEADGDVAVVRIDRPPANALNFELLAEGRAACERLASEQPGAVVITGRPRFFCAGLDLRLAPTLDEAGQREMVSSINRLFAAWYGFPRPVVCAVNGHAIAGGLILALCGDHRVGARDARYGLTELRAGLPYPAVAIAVVRAELAAGAMRRLALRADLVDGAGALELGALDELAGADDVLPRALDVARELGTMPGQAYGRVKRQVREPALREMEHVLTGGLDPMLAGWIGDEAARASKAILAS